jgi:hypothetical protein
MFVRTKKITFRPSAAVEENSWTKISPFFRFIDPTFEGGHTKSKDQNVNMQLSLGNLPRDQGDQIVRVVASGANVYLRQLLRK